MNLHLLSPPTLTGAGDNEREEVEEVDLVETGRSGKEGS
jgi:hypothetical protein